MLNLRLFCLHYWFSLTSNWICLQHRNNVSLACLRCTLKLKHSCIVKSCPGWFCNFFPVQINPKPSTGPQQWRLFLLYLLHATWLWETSKPPEKVHTKNVKCKLEKPLLCKPQWNSWICCGWRQICQKQICLHVHDLANRSHKRFKHQDAAPQEYWLTKPRSGQSV